MIVSWGELLWDLYPDGRRLGGAPANVAFHLAALGVPVALATRVGDDEPGHAAIAAMSAAGVDTSLVQVDAQRPTGAVGIVITGGEAPDSLHAECAWERIAMTDAVRDALATARALCFGSLSQTHADGRASFREALAATPPGCMKICDINLRPGYVDVELARFSLGCADVVKLNELEASLLAGHLDVDDITTHLLEHAGVRIVALTRGPRGSRLITASGACDHPGFAAAPGGDNVGAGDAFTAVIARAVALGLPLDTANAAANRYASYVASQRGATPVVAATLITDLLATGSERGEPESPPCR